MKWLNGMFWRWSCLRNADEDIYTPDFLYSLTFTSTPRMNMALPLIRQLNSTHFSTTLQFNIAKYKNMKALFSRAILALFSEFCTIHIFISYTTGFMMGLNGLGFRFHCVRLNCFPTCLLTSNIVTPLLCLCYTS